MHLSRIMQDCNKKEKSEKAIVSTASSCLSERKPEEDVEKEEYGLIDSIELGQESFENAEEIVQRIAEMITVLGQKMSERTKELDGGKTPTGITDIKKARRTSDITYVQLLHENIYLAVILDLSRRKCIEWDLGRNMGRQLVMNALARALKNHWTESTQGLIHHSDQGFNIHPKIMLIVLKSTTS